MVKALVIDIDGSTRVVETPGKLDDLRALLGGGWLEGINGPDWHAYVDEEGKIKGLPVNVFGTVIARHLGWMLDDLSGPIIFLGTGKDGAEADCPSHILELIEAGA